MHLRSDHVEEGIPKLRQLIRENPLDVEDENNETELGVLRCHVARQNPQAKAMIDSLESRSQGSASYLEQEVLVLFNSPIHHYVTPKFYTETKPTTGKVVPTWNYAAVQAYGRAKVYYDPKSEESKAFLSRQLHDLSQFSETSVMGYTGVGDKPVPWKVSDAPERYLELKMKNIIGLEITVDRLEGKFKMSQEMSRGDREGVIQGFGSLQSEVGTKMSQLVKERSDLKEAKSA